MRPLDYLTPLKPTPLGWKKLAAATITTPTSQSTIQVISLSIQPPIANILPQAETATLLKSPQAETVTSLKLPPAETVTIPKPATSDHIIKLKQQIARRIKNNNERILEIQSSMNRMTSDLSAENANLMELFMSI